MCVSSANYAAVGAVIAAAGTEQLLQEQRSSRRCSSRQIAGDVAGNTQAAGGAAGSTFLILMVREASRLFSFKVPVGLSVLAVLAAMAWPAADTDAATGFTPVPAAVKAAWLQLGAEAGTAHMLPPTESGYSSLMHA